MPKQQNQEKIEFSNGRVRDTYYYDILEVDCNASYSVIERQCYELARMYHPDKLDSTSSSSSSTTATRKKEAEILFKEIAEAYQVLGDPKLRERYDRVGKDAIQNSIQDSFWRYNVDPTVLLGHLFGSHQFEDYLGKLSFSAVTSLLTCGDTDQYSSSTSIKNLRKIQQRRCTRLAFKLVDKFNQTSTTTLERRRTIWAAEAKELSLTSFGWELLQVIGMVRLVLVNCNRKCYDLRAFPVFLQL